MVSVSTRPIPGIVLSKFRYTGCGTTKIFHAHFDGGTGSPAGPVPNNPGYILVNGGTNDYPKIVEDELWFWESEADGRTRTYLASIDVNESESTKTISWTGRRTSGENTAPFVIDISAQSGVSTIQQWPNKELRVRISKTRLEVLTYEGIELMNFSLDPDVEHEVFISLRLSDNTFKVKVQQPNNAEMNDNDVLPTSTANLIKSHSNLFIRAWFPTSQNFILISRYRMDDIIMRERD